MQPLTAMRMLGELRRAWTSATSCSSCAPPGSVTRRKRSSK